MQGSVFGLGSLIILKRATISLNRLKSAILQWKFLVGNGMERAFENQECIMVSLPCVYNCSLVLKTEKRSLSKALNVSSLNPFPLELTLPMAQWVWVAPLALSGITSDQNFRKVGSYLGEKGPRLPETPQKRPHFLDAASNKKRFENL